MAHEKSKLAGVVEPPESSAEGGAANAPERATPANRAASAATAGDATWAEPPVETSGNGRASTITRVLDLLDAVAAAERPMTPAELHEQLAIPKATVHRLCATLEERGYLQSRLSGRGLIPGRRLHTLALGVLASSPYRAQRHAILKQLSQDVGETCNISVPDGSEMIYFDRAETHWPVRIQLQIGSRVPLHCTASGKMYLSSLPAARRNRILDAGELARHARNTILDPQLLGRDLGKIEERDFSLDNEEFIDGMVAIAVPLRDQQERLFATLALHAPVMRVGLEQLEGYLPRLREAAGQLRELA